MIMILGACMSTSNEDRGRRLSLLSSVLQSEPITLRFVSSEALAVEFDKRRKLLKVRDCHFREK